jgi:hypothetical protein
MAQSSPGGFLANLPQVAVSRKSHGATGARKARWRNVLRMVMPKAIANVCKHFKKNFANLLTQNLKNDKLNFLPRRGSCKRLQSSLKIISDE